jgi:outer membrane biosynthesis protein TonB
MGKVRVCIVLSEDLLDGFKSRGLTNLSGALEELLAAFLSVLPPEYRRRGAKETRELVRRFLEGRSVQESPSTQQEILQQLMTLIQTLQTPSQPPQTFQPPPPPPSSPQPQYQPPPQPKPTVQEQKQKPRVSVKEFLRVVREHAIEHGVPPELVDYERILEEARREAEEDEEK